MLKNKQNNYQNYAYFIKKHFDKASNSICLLTKDNFESRYIYNELSILFDKDCIKLFPENDILPYDHFSTPEKITKQRFKLINQQNNKKHILISSVKNLFEIYPNKYFFKSEETFSINDELSINSIVNIVEILNYQKKTNVENINEYSVRGGIIDIFTPIYENPLRIEIFDDYIESIRFFDIESQLSIENIKNFSISKGSLFSLDDLKVSSFISRWRDYFTNIDERYCSLFQKIKNYEIPEGIEVYFPFFFKDTSTFLEIFNNYEFIKYEDLDNEIDLYESLINNRYKDESQDLNRPLIKPSDLFLNVKNILDFTQSIKKIDVEKINYSYESFKDIEEGIVTGDFDNKKIILMSSIPSELEKLKEKYKTQASEIKNIHEVMNNISIMFGDITRPIYIQDNNTFIFHKEYIDKSVYKVENSNARSTKKENLSKLFNKDDLVIHEDYGLGIYDGLEVVEANNKFSEYLKIIYDKNEILYVPLKNIHKISNYHKNNNINIKIDSLSSNKWSVKKSKANKRVVDHAAEILDIESRRSNANSSSLKPDKDIFLKFENEFPYNETPDQIESISSIKKDLSLIKPMNRVLCGDVGFGKTEVAMRSSLISVSSNKQVVIVTPSTVLCDQHYDTFIKRFENFPVSINKLNRFTSKKNKEKIIDDFNSCKTDILICTHIVFNNNLSFENTGLLIIDEEHKFGIKQKNFIKDKQANVHVLYLSATPIPRTMNLVFSGLKDFSFLQTPPTNRINIKSFLKIQTSQLIKEALTREKVRGGQCFIVQNDIDKMDNIKKEINNLLPEFKVSIAHGRLSKKELRNVMNNFKNGEIDGLICTTIIEMGLDIPNANTMVIINSHNFGLSQLHQLRGRVGRSEKQGYCYFLIPTLDIPKLSRNRLDSIIKHSNLGEGFLIAEEDLELRGGGEMLGDKQSGHIDNIGLSLYLSMLKDAINSQKNIYHHKDIDIEINFYDSAYISEAYLPSPLERLKIYKKLNELTSLEELKALKTNLKDRCGKIPIETKNLIDNKRFHLKVLNSGIKSIKSNSKNTNIEITKEIKDSYLDKLINFAKKDPQKFQINSTNKFIYKYHELNAEVRRQNIDKLLDEIF